MRLLKLFLVALAGIGAQPALAHTELTESVPADRAMLESAPQELSLRFSEPVHLTALSVRREDEAAQSLGPLTSDAATHFVVAAPALEDGHYSVSWRALSQDTHVMTGQLTFTIGATSDQAQHTTHPAPAAGGHDGGEGGDEHAAHSATR